MYTIAINLPYEAGDVSEFRAWAYLNGVLLNAGGTVLVEVLNGYFTGDITEDPNIDAVYRIDITKDAVLIGSGWLRPAISNLVNDPTAGALELSDTVITDLAEALNEFLVTYRQYTSRAV